jgi:hypothetical protein
MKRYIKPEITSVDIRNEEICSNGLLVSSVSLYKDEDIIVDQDTEILTKDAVWDEEW